MVSGYSLRLGVLPNPAIPARPANGAQPIGLPSISATKRRTGPLDPACLATGKYQRSVRSYRDAYTFRRKVLQNNPARDARADFEFGDFSVLDLIEQRHQPPDFSAE